MKKKLLSILILLSLLLQISGFGSSWHSGGAVFADDATELTKVKLSDMILLRNDGTPFPAGNVVIGHDSAFKIKFTFDLSYYGSSLKKGDYFIIKVPEEINFWINDPSFTFPVDSPEMNDDGSPIPMAYATVYKATASELPYAKIVLDEYVEGKEENRGSVTFSYVFNKTTVEEETENLVINLTTGVAPDLSTISATINQVKPKDKVPPDQFIAKWAGGETTADKELEYAVRINFKKDPLSNGLVIKDKLTVPTGFTVNGMDYNKDSFTLRRVVLDEYGQVQHATSGPQTSLTVGEHENYSLTITDSNSAAGPTFTLTFKKFEEEHRNSAYLLRYKINYPYEQKVVVTNYIDITNNTTYQQTNYIFRNNKFSGSGFGVFKGKVTIVKVDSTNENVGLAGAVFEIINESGSVLETLTTGANGTVTSTQTYSEGTKLIVKEKTPPKGYHPSNDEYNITINADGKNDGDVAVIKNDPVKRTINVEKQWVGNSAGAVKVQLLESKSKNIIKEIELSETNSWKSSFEVRMYDTAGEEIEYTVKEIVPDGYKAEVTGDMENGFTITNTKNPSQVETTTPSPEDETTTEAETTTTTTSTTTTTTTTTTEKVTEVTTDATTETTSTTQEVENSESETTVDITVNKVWEGEPGTKAVVHLLAEGVIIDTVELNEANNWKHTFTALPEYNGTNKIKYSVGEQSMSGYTAKISILSPGVYEITNTRLDTEIDEDEETFIWYSEDTPFGGANPTLPYTAMLPNEFSFGLGLLIIALGVTLNVKKNK